MTEAVPHRKVLVVEDEALLLFSIADDLRAAGFEVIEASNADQAIAILGTDRDITLVFTDIDMPGSMDGLKLARVVRDRWPPVKIVITSGKLRPANQDVPPDSVFVPKPYTPARVASLIGSLLGA